jgi:hypothetical protein
MKRGGIGIDTGESAYQVQRFSAGLPGSKMNHPAQSGGTVEGGSSGFENLYLFQLFSGQEFPMHLGRIRR